MNVGTLCQLKDSRSLTHTCMIHIIHILLSGADTIMDNRQRRPSHKHKPAITNYDVRVHVGKHRGTIYSTLTDTTKRKVSWISFSKSKQQTGRGNTPVAYLHAPTSCGMLKLLAYVPQERPPQLSWTHTCMYMYTCAHVSKDMHIIIIIVCTCIQSM